MLNLMTQRDRVANASEMATRVERGDFDPALRPASHEEALREGPERFFALAAEVARSQFDPAEHWDDFVHALWEQADAGFGLSATDAKDGTGETAWFDDPEDPPVVAWERRPGGS